MNIPLRHFLEYVDGLSREKSDFQRTVLLDALREVLARLGADKAAFDLAVADPGGPAWAYVLSAGRRQQIDTPTGHIEDLLARPLELADAN